MFLTAQPPGSHLNPRPLQCSRGCRDLCNAGIWDQASWTSTRSENRHTDSSKTWMKTLCNLLLPKAECNADFRSQPLSSPIAVHARKANVLWKKPQGHGVLCFPVEAPPAGQRKSLSSHSVIDSYLIHSLILFFFSCCQSFYFIAVCQLQTGLMVKQNITT